MRIYSKFHDYYDPALRDFSAEPTPVYERATRFLTLENVRISGVHKTRWYYPAEKRLLATGYLSDLDNDDLSHRNSSITIQLMILGFCGKIYPLYSHQSTWYPFVGDINIYRKLDPSSFTPNGFLPSKDAIDGYDGIESSRIFLDLFLAHKTPSFLWLSSPRRHGEQEYNLILDPVLKDIGFQKVVPPWEAMQELQMFLGNDLVQDKQPVMPVGGDKVIAASKGFDKWSFRKMPEPK